MDTKRKPGLVGRWHYPCAGGIDVAQLRHHPEAASITRGELSASGLRCLRRRAAGAVLGSVPVFGIPHRAALDMAFTDGHLSDHDHLRRSAESAGSGR